MKLTTASALSLLQPTPATLLSSSCHVFVCISYTDPTPVVVCAHAWVGAARRPKTGTVHRPTWTKRVGLSETHCSFAHASLNSATGASISTV